MAPPFASCCLSSNSKLSKDFHWQTSKQWLIDHPAFEAISSFRGSILPRSLAAAAAGLPKEHWKKPHQGKQCFSPIAGSILRRLWLPGKMKTGNPHRDMVSFFAPGVHRLVVHVVGGNSTTLPV
jgi:hypothetical protein